MTATAPKLVRIECVCNPDLHLGDGRRLIGPVREGTRVVQHGYVAEVDADLAGILIDNGQAKESKLALTDPRKLLIGHD
ncbi:hypothetical protein [Sphingobium olei]|uniref:Uncharacterized protein n=1 Tax=Sphingobium olei TaxID=420955 RepID=A0ABW3NW13_9SPHN